MDGGIFWPQLKGWLWIGAFFGAIKRVALDGGIFWPQLKGLLWMGLFFSRN